MGFKGLSYASTTFPYTPCGSIALSFFPLPALWNQTSLCEAIVQQTGHDSGAGRKRTIGSGRTVLQTSLIFSPFAAIPLSINTQKRLAEKRVRLQFIAHGSNHTFTIISLKLSAIFRNLSWCSCTAVRHVGSPCKRMKKYQADEMSCKLRSRTSERQSKKWNCEIRQCFRARLNLL